MYTALYVLEKARHHLLQPNEHNDKANKYYISCSSVIGCGREMHRARGGRERELPKSNFRDSSDVISKAVLLNRK